MTPAGKQITRLAMLSGGEKALAAIAFLFAIMLARPCPFYVLDEVDAALDDANVERFLTLVDRYREQAQFIVITHQKRTMEMADALYGVTMAGDGISKVVSRRLPRDRREAFAPAPIVIDYSEMFIGLSGGEARADGAPEERRRGLFRRLVENLSTSRKALTQQIATIAFDPADDAVWEELEEALLLADCGVPGHRRDRRPAGAQSGGGRAAHVGTTSRRRCARSSPRCWRVRSRAST